MKKKSKSISDHELLAVINGQISNATGGNTSTINDKKATALDYYYGDDSLIDSEEGESSFITREVFENVERELGRQIKVFASGETVVKFDPVGPEDEDQAAQETDYVNYIFNKQNDGFKIIHDWIKSALIEKLGYVKAWPEKKTRHEVQTYTNLTDAELGEVLDQEGVEALEHDETVSELEGVTFHDVKVRVTTEETIIRVEAVPGEEVGVARNHNQLSLKDCTFVYHKPSNVTASDLIESGFDKNIVDQLAGYDSDENELATARDNNTDEDPELALQSDDSTRIIEVYECYIRMDYDKDGIAELRKVTTSGNFILENEETDFIPFASLCPIPMPFKHEGLSWADMIMSVQDVNTVLTQQMLTNLYFTNMPEREVVTDEVNIDDLLTHKSGSLKRVNAPGMIRDLTVPFTAGQSLPILEMMDGIAERRVGRNQPLDPDVLRDTTENTYALGTQQSNEISEKLARVFAETGFTELFGMIHELAIKNSDKVSTVKLRNEYVEIDPTEWKHRTNMSVVVGLGTGNRDQELGQLMAIAQKQEEHLGQGSPLTTPKKLYNTLARIIERAGLKDASAFWLDPESEEAKQIQQQQAQQPPPPDPNMIMIQANKAIEDQKAALVSQKQQQDAYFKQKDQDIKERELVVREIEVGTKTKLEAAKIEQDRYEADLKAETDLAINSMKLGASFQEAIAANGQMSADNDARLTEMMNAALLEISAMGAQNLQGMTGIADGLGGQIDTMAAQMARPKQVIYDPEGNPVRVETIG